MCVIRYKGKLDHSNGVKDLLSSHCLSDKLDERLGKVYYFNINQKK